MLGKELRELNSFLGEGAASVNARRNTVDLMPDPLLSPFLCGLTLSDAKDKRDANSGIDSRVVPTPVGAKRYLFHSSLLPKSDNKESSCCDVPYYGEYDLVAS